MKGDSFENSSSRIPTYYITRTTKRPGEIDARRGCLHPYNRSAVFQEFSELFMRMRDLFNDLQSYPSAKSFSLGIELLPQCVSSSFTLWKGRKRRSTSLADQGSLPIKPPSDLRIPIQDGKVVLEQRLKKENTLILPHGSRIWLSASLLRSFASLWEGSMSIHCQYSIYRAKYLPGILWMIMGLLYICASVIPLLIFPALFPFCNLG